MRSIYALIVLIGTLMMASPASAANGDHIATFNDPGASANAPVLDYPEQSGTTYNGSFGSHYRLPGGPESVYRDCAYLTGLNLACLQNRQYVGEFRVRPGDQVSGAGRNEAGQSNTSQVPLMPDHGDEMVLSGAFMLVPGHCTRDSVSGLNGVFMQVKGADPGPWMSWADGASNALHLRSSANGLNYWTSGYTYADICGKWFRYRIHVKWHSTDGFIKLWTALGDAPLTQRTMNNGSTVWTGRTTASNEVDEMRWRVGMYYDEPVVTDKRLMSAGQAQILCVSTDLGCADGLNRGTPPVPVGGTTPPPDPTPTPTPTPTPSPTPTPTPSPTPTPTPEPADCAADLVPSTNLHYNSRSRTSIYLDWNSYEDEAGYQSAWGFRDGYWVEVKNDNGTVRDMNGSAPGTSAFTSASSDLNITGLTRNTYYRFRVQAQIDCDQDGTPELAPWSAEYRQRTSS